MNQEKQAVPSPFSALTYQEQQDRWLEWRSRQLDYRPVSSTPPADFEKNADLSGPAEEDLPPIRLPNLRAPAPTRHRELDQVWARHQQAMRRAGTFHPVKGND